MTAVGGRDARDTGVRRDSGFWQSVFGETVGRG
jgi:hypothetical protein